MEAKPRLRRSLRRLGIPPDFPPVNRVLAHILAAHSPDDVQDGESVHQGLKALQSSPVEISGFWSLLPDEVSRAAFFFRTLIVFVFTSIFSLIGIA